MKKKVWLILCLFILLLIPVIPVSAKSITNISASISNDKQVSINGNVSNGKGKTINLRVTDPLGSVDYVDSQVCTKSGKFDFCYRMTNEHYGIYDVSLKIGDDDYHTSYEYGVDNNLKSLTFNKGKLNQEFSSDITEYELEVGSSEQRVKLSAAVSDSCSLLEINGKAANSGSITSIILNKETTKIEIKVTSLDGVEKTYYVSVVRSNSNLPVITEQVSLNQNNMVTVEGIISTGPGQVISIRVKDPDGILDYANTILSAEGGNFEISYFLNNKKTGKYTAELSTHGMNEVQSVDFYYLKEVSLKSLSVGELKLSPSFKSNTETYSTTAEDLDSITVLPVACDGADKIVVNKQIVEGGKESRPIHLLNGSNTVTVTVSARNGALSKVYYIKIQKKETLPKLSFTVTLDDKKIVNVMGNTGIKAGKPVEVMIKAPDGEIEYTNIINSALDGSFVCSYKFTNKKIGTYKVYVSTKGMDAPKTAEFKYKPILGLSGLSVDNAVISPAFAEKQQEYNASVKNMIDHVSVLATAIDSNTTITVNGIPVKSGEQSQIIMLEVGKNLIEVTDTGGDESLSYHITINREAVVASDACVLTGMVSPTGMTVDESLRSVKKEVSYETESVTLEASVSKNAVWELYKDSECKTAISNHVMDLEIGTNTAYLKVTAQNQTSSRIYKVEITREASDACALTGMVSPTGMTVNESLRSVKKEVSYETESITLVASVSKNAVWELYEDSSCKTVINNHVMNLEIGTNTAYLKVTAQNQTMVKIYTVTIVRLNGSNDANLLSIGIDAGKDQVIQFPKFSQTVQYYRVYVGENTDSITITPAVKDSTSSVTIQNTSIEGSQKIPITEEKKSAKINLGSDINLIEITVTAQDLTKKTYTLRVVCSEDNSSTELYSLSLLTRNASNDLQWIDDPNGQVDLHEYYSFSKELNNIYISFNGCYNHAFALIQNKSISGSNVIIADSGEVSDAIPLIPGGNEIELTVYSRDLSSVMTYQITISNYDLQMSNLVMLNGTVTPAFQSDVTQYTASVTGSSITMTPYMKNENVTITITNNANASTATVDSGETATIQLALGSNTIHICVTSKQDDNCKLDYTLTVVRKYKPIAVSGFNEDVVANGSYNSSDDNVYTPSGTTTTSIDGSYILYEDNYVGINSFPGVERGLVHGGAVSKATIDYQLQNYSDNNALLITNGNPYTLFINSGAKYSDLSILATGTKGSSECTVTLNFSDGTSSDYNLSIYDWYTDGVNYDIKVGRISRSVLIPDWNKSFGIKGYGIALTDEDKQKVLQSITFTRSVGSTGYIAVFAISGL